MPLNAEDVQSWDLPKLDKAIDEIRDNVASLREKNGGTLVGMKGADADTVRDAMQDLNLLGEARDGRREQEGNEQQFARLSEYMNEPDPERAVAHGNGKQKAEGPSDIGGMFIQSDAWKAFQTDGRLNVPARVPTSALFGRNFQGIGEIPGDQLRMQAATFDSSGFATRRDFRDDQLVDTLYQANNIGPLMPQGTTDSDTITYPVETVTATGATEVAEGSTKPEAQISFADTDEPVRLIAVLLPVTNKALRNQPFLRAYLNARLRLFVQMREDAQLLNGNGTAPNLKGILNRSGVNTATSYSIGGSNPDQALIDAVFHAAMRVRDSYLEPDAAVMKPATWEIAALAKDGNRNYLLGGPGASGYAGNDPISGPRLWGLRVVLNANMPAQAATNKPVLVGAWRTSAMVVRRGGIDLALSESHSTFFAENKVMLRAEEELALCVFRPAGFAAVTSAA
jgi:HK97 family phage major capsid protein